jgi:hypothetical protein
MRGTTMDGFPRVYFGVFGFDDDPRVVSEAVRLEATEAWRKGDASPGG